MKEKIRVLKNFNEHFDRECQSDFDKFDRNRRILSKQWKRKVLDLEENKLIIKQELLMT